MEDKSKAEKRATGRLLLQQYQKKTKDVKPSISPNNLINIETCESKSDLKLSEHENLKNGYSDQINAQVNSQAKGALEFYTFHKNESPAELFFDSFRVISQQSSTDHSDCDSEEVPSVPLYNVSDRVKDNIYYRSYTSSSRSSKSDDKTLKRLTDGQLSSDIFVKEELETKLIESNEKVIFLENEVGRLRGEIDALKNQQIPLEGKVQLHLKTIEILVSEKSELQQELIKIKEESSVDKSKFEQLTSKWKTCEDQIRNLRSELTEMYEAREQHNMILKKLEQSLAETNLAAESYRKEVIDAKAEINVLKQKNEQVDNHSQKIKKQIHEKDKQLSLAEMRLAQLGGGGVPTKAEVNKLEELEKECVRLNNEIGKLQKEKTDIVSQYQQYIDTLNSQVQLLNQQYESCLISKNQLLTREESLVKHISELEKRVQKEHQAGPSLAETNSRINQELKETKTKIAELNSSLNEKNEEVIRLNAALDETSSKLSEAELALERLEVPDARKLQAAMENDRVAATRAVQQNAQLKLHVVELQEAIVRLNNEKLELTEKWQHSEHVLSELNRELNRYQDLKSVEHRDAVAQCTVVFFAEQGCQASIDDIEIPANIEHITPEAVGLLEKKLKKTMNDYANLYEENQRLEHLVLHLQSETDTIGEYVTLYQNQRSLLQERATERDRQMAVLAKEREELKLKLAQISSLLPQVIQDSELEPVHSSITNGMESKEGPANQIKTLLTEIECSSLMKDGMTVVPNNFHPCLVCSGKLMTV